MKDNKIKNKQTNRQSDRKAKTVVPKEDKGRKKVLRGECKYLAGSLEELILGMAQCEVGMLSRVELLDYFQ